MNEKDLEKEIIAKGLNSPRITPEHIDSVIKSETYTIMPSGKVMICELTLVNGFTVRGEASVVSNDNFDEKIGKTISKDRTRNKIWELEGYLLQQRLYESKKE